MKERKGAPALKYSPAEIHLKTVMQFVEHYCECFTWQKFVLGTLRARNLSALLKFSDVVQEDLINAATRDTSHHTEYGDALLFERGCQFVALVSKYQYPDDAIPGLDPIQRAKENFLLAERRNRRLNIVFRTHRTRGTERHWCVPGIRKVILRVLGKRPHYEDIFQKCDFSGGASQNHHGDLTHLATKLLGSKFTGRAEALDYFKEAVWRNKHYRQMFLRFPSTTTDVWEQFSSNVDRLFEVSSHNNVTIVAKNAKTGRSIAIEPEVNNFLQKGIDLEMRRLLLRRLNLDLSEQSVNQIMAHEGSDPSVTDPYVTIDIRDASNGVLVELVRSVVPDRWYKLLTNTRSTDYELDGVVRPYEMLCSMGNGFCFPLETLLFSAIVISAHRHVGAPVDFRCYGDDIICRQSVALVVIESLKACGFRTNMSKTFVFGPFRESCGANCYDGRDVTPGYYKTPVSSLSELYALHNSLHKWPLVQQWLRGVVTNNNAHLVPNTKPYDWVTDQAFRVESDVWMSGRGTRWNRRNQKWEYSILTGSPVADENWRKDSGCDQALLDALVLTAVLRGSKPEEPFHHRRRTRHRTTWSLRTDGITERSVKQYDFSEPAMSWYAQRDFVALAA